MGWQARGGSRHLAYWDQQVAGRYSEDKMQMYPGGLAEGPVLTPRQKLQPMQRIDQSMNIQVKVKSNHHAICSQ